MPVPHSLVECRPSVVRSGHCSVPASESSCYGAHFPHLCDLHALLAQLLNLDDVVGPPGKAFEDLRIGEKNKSGPDLLVHFSILLEGFESQDKLSHHPLLSGLSELLRHVLLEDDRFFPGSERLVARSVEPRTKSLLPIQHDPAPSAVCKHDRLA